MIVADTLHVILRHTSAEEVWHAWCQNSELSLDCSNAERYRESQTRPPLYYQDFQRNQYTASLQDTFRHYTADDARNALESVPQLLKNSSFLKNTGIFGVIIQSVQDMLKLDETGNCLCKYNKLLDYRMMTHSIGSSIFQAAFSAYSDFKSGNRVRCFSVSPVLHTDNKRLYHILNRGIAENHFHMGGSSHAFLSSWVCLMNHMSGERQQEFYDSKIDSDALDDHNVFSRTKGSAYSLTFKAAYLRLFLFHRFRDDWLILQEPEQARDRQTIAEQQLKRVLSYSNDECAMLARDLDVYMDAMRIVHNTGIFDYASPRENELATISNKMTQLELAKENEKRIYQYLSGEQYFLYQIFYSVLTRDPRVMKYADLMYAYLLVWCKIRGELVQTNPRIGFDNFSAYQDRKNIFTQKYSKYDKARDNAAIQSLLCDPRCQSLEGRFVPGDTEFKMKSKIEYWKECAKKESEDSLEENQKLHFVVHFPKSPYHPKMGNHENAYYEMTHSCNAEQRQTVQKKIYEDAWYERTHPRNAEQRQMAEKRTQVILQLRDQQPELMRCITGVDGCSHEIGCRPEVFSSCIRHLCSSRPSSANISNVKLPQLYRTYHVGEDFLCILDGLRATDEAIKFLDMDVGDRLGHALALGYDVEKWYASKNNIIILPKQDLLDNIVWLYGKSQEYGLPTAAIEGEVQKQFNALFASIYRKNIPFDHGLCSVDCYTYYLSMQLRGNDPKLYLEYPLQDENNSSHDDLDKNREEYCRKFKNKLLWEPWLIPEFNFEIRNDNYYPISQASELYHYYHFNPNCKWDGFQKEEYEVPSEIIHAVADIQEKMQYDIARRHIEIECNPSSNWLIGNFRDYAKHPIIRFYDGGLFDTPDNPRLSVSINTDDAGVFDTSLENEYALMACALEQKIRQDNNHITPDHIYRWLDRIREMGLEQSFLLRNS